MSGTVSIYESRRINYEKCRWWSRSDFDRTVPLSVIAHDNEPKGTFYARESRELMQSMSGADIKHTDSMIAITTTDDIWNKVKVNDLVSYCGNVWIVTSISLKKDWKRSQFSKRNSDGVKILYLRGK